MKFFDELLFFRFQLLAKSLRYDKALVDLGNLLRQGLIKLVIGFNHGF